MSHAIDVTEEHGYLHFRVSGSNSLENVLGYLSAVHAACVRRECQVALIEENLDGPSLDIADIFSIASVGSRATAPAVRAIAFVDTNPQHSREKMQFAENVAVTRGINVRIFDSVSAAQNWAQNQAAALRTGDAPP